MNDTEINAIAQGTFMYFKEQCKDPQDAIAVILCLALVFYEQCRDPSTDYSIEEFANQFSKDIVYHWNHRRVASKGTETVQ